MLLGSVLFVYGYGHVIMFYCLGWVGSHEEETIQGDSGQVRIQGRIYSGPC